MTAHATLMEFFLIFLGLGIPPHLASWGTMMNESQRDIMRGIWWTTLSRNHDRSYGIIDMPGWRFIERDFGAQTGDKE